MIRIIIILAYCFLLCSCFNSSNVEKLSDAKGLFPIMVVVDGKTTKITYSESKCFENQWKWCDITLLHSWVDRFNQVKWMDSPKQTVNLSGKKYSEISFANGRILRIYIVDQTAYLIDNKKAGYISLSDAQHLLSIARQIQLNKLQFRYAESAQYIKSGEIIMIRDTEKLLGFVKGLPVLEQYKALNAHPDVLSDYAIGKSINNNIPGEIIFDQMLSLRFGRKEENTSDIYIWMSNSPAVLKVKFKQWDKFRDFLNGVENDQKNTN